MMIPNKLGAIKQTKLRQESVVTRFGWLGGRMIPGGSLWQG
jgi:hypothetical protein